MAMYNLAVAWLYKYTLSADRIISPSSPYLGVYPDVFYRVAKGFFLLPFTSVKRSSVFNTLRIISFLFALTFPFSVSLLALRVSQDTDVVLQYDVCGPS